MNNQGFFNLPPGVHVATWNEFYEYFNTSWRRTVLLEYLLIVLLHLRNAGCKFVKIDGSFVTSKLIPRDFDGTSDPQGVNITMLDESIKNMNRDLMYDKFMGELY